MEIIKPKIFQNFPEVKCGFSTKVGHNNEPPFHFNMSHSVGDDPKNVESNRMKFFAHFGLGKNEVALQRQVHSDIVTKVNKSGLIGESDAMITSKKNLGLAVSSADCAPVFLFDSRNKVIAAIHSGWKGTKEKITLKTCEKLSQDFSSKPEDLFCYIGPSISQENYEVGKEFDQFFNMKYLKYHNDKYHLDVKSANLDMLLDFGIPRSQIEVSKLCSFEEKYLHSYRREGKRSGRALGLIVIKDENE